MIPTVPCTHDDHGHVALAVQARSRSRARSPSRHNGSSVPAMSAFHDLEMTSITGDQVSFDQFHGQLCLVVNVASF